MNANAILNKVLDGILNGTGIIIALVLVRKFLPGTI
jgi:hypothetical protein